MNEWRLPAVWDHAVLCGLVPHHDAVHHPVPAGDQGRAHRGDCGGLAQALAVEEICGAGRKRPKRWWAAFLMHAQCRKPMHENCYLHGRLAGRQRSRWPCKKNVHIVRTQSLLLLGLLGDPDSDVNGIACTDLCQAVSDASS